VYLYVSYGSHNEQPLFPRTALTGFFCSGGMIQPISREVRTGGTQGAWRQDELIGGKPTVVN
jgi:hypothetical protein